MIWWEDFALWAIGLFAVVFVSLAVWVGINQARTGRECLALGYPLSTWGPIAGSYCIAREDQSDVVRTLDDARLHPRH